MVLATEKTLHNLVWGTFDTPSGTVKLKLRLLLQGGNKKVRGSIKEPHKLIQDFELQSDLKTGKKY